MTHSEWRPCGKVTVEWVVMISFVATLLIGCATSSPNINSASLSFPADPVMKQGSFTSAAFPYMEGSTALEGFIASPTTPGKHPAVLVIHDWNGQDDYEAGRAKQLAAMGYVGVAIDVYGKRVRPKTPAESGAEAGKYYTDRDLFRRRLQAAFDAVKALPNVDTSKMAAIGYCFGGGGVLEMARMGLPLKGVASFHGGFKTDKPAQAGMVKAKVLIQHALGDPASPRADQEALLKELTDAGVDFQATFYNLNTHAFTVPGAMYNADADRRSWKALNNFLSEIFS